MGRGGDMTLFASGGVQAAPEEHKLKYDNSNFSLISYISDLLANQPANVPNEDMEE